MLYYKHLHIEDNKCKCFIFEGMLQILSTLELCIMHWCVRSLHQVQLLNKSRFTKNLLNHRFCKREHPSKGKLWGKHRRHFGLQMLMSLSKLEPTYGCMCIQNVSQGDMWFRQPSCMFFASIFCLLCVHVYFHVIYWSSPAGILAKNLGEFLLSVVLLRMVGENNSAFILLFNKYTTLFTNLDSFSRCYEVDWKSRIVAVTDLYVVLDKPAGISVCIFLFNKILKT